MEVEVTQEHIDQGVNAVVLALMDAGFEHVAVDFNEREEIHASWSIENLPRQDGFTGERPHQKPYYQRQKRLPAQALHPTLQNPHSYLCRRLESQKLIPIGKIPEKTVKAKSKLNHAILDQGWGEFRRQLAYKTELNGGTFVAVPPTNTSRTCARAADTSPPATESVKRGSSASVAALKLTPTR